MTTSAVQIANIALTTYIGAERIISMDDQSKEAFHCKLHFDDARQELLSEWTWSFATKRERLAKLAVNDKEEWESKFALPIGLMRLNWVNDPASAKEAILCREVYDTPRLVEGAFIFSDLDEASCEFVFDNEDVSSYPPKFTQAFAALLASKIALPLVETASKAQNALAAYVDYLDAAKVHDIQMERPIIVRRSSNWSEVR